MNLQAIRIFVEEDFSSFHVNVWVIETKGTERFSIHYDGELLVYTKMKETESPSSVGKPLLRLPRDFSYHLFKSIADYNSEKGIKTKSDHNIEGQLTAKNEHLKDMQTIVMKLLKIP